MVPSITIHRQKRLKNHCVVQDILLIFAFIINQAAIFNLLMDVEQEVKASDQLRSLKCILVLNITAKTRQNVDLPCLFRVNMEAKDYLDIPPMWLIASSDHKIGFEFIDAV